MNALSLTACFISLYLPDGLLPARAEQAPIRSAVETVRIEYRGRIVRAKKLTVSTELALPRDTVWQKVQTSALLEWVTRGKVRFLPTAGAFPAVFREGETVSTRMKLYGFLPFGGLHTLQFVRIDSSQAILETQERDRAAKVWNHRISLQALGTGRTRYEDEVIIYGGLLTGPITTWARAFYRHRQKRWQQIRWLEDGSTLPALATEGRSR